jgi:bla regulator protein BlaR1
MAKKRVLKASIRRNSKKTGLIVLVIVLTILINSYIGAMIIFKGPSPTFSNIVVSTMMETRRGKRLMKLFFNKKEIEEIIAQNTISSVTTVTDDIDDGFDIPENKKDKIDIIDIEGPTYNGKLMIVYDPSRIELGVNTLMDTQYAKGFYVEEFVASENAIAGINAGGFDDPGGKGDGSIPYGVVIKDGELIAGKLTDYYEIIGFNEHHRLVVGQMTGQQALDYGLVDAVTFKPIFIVNYVPVEIVGTGGGLNPRTVIGQREDGAVLLLVINGRQANSLGASYADCINIMMEYGAINAANLDGGSSSVMVYDGEIINSVVSMQGDRAVPTAWIVK